ncbi:hypothetical protein [Candidatus Reidiella endopervernicosa]|uniref:Uncharacterized protein n=1 Tax=Candidatus Reidiella endopervernicosa TaxID=2738883 RepID=A0A6N0HWS9_9GAMM|nr:hypothetical protein [Candidatus Reidiella endopervernicosa]QKQ26814.1 hypothetical protein HUE57_11360 [Candidatus Reidiella endopervernicosa]
MSNSIGTVSLSDSSITNSSTAVDGLDIDNSGLATGILILTVDGLAFSGDTTLSGMQNAVDIITSTSSTINATITGSSFTNTWKDGIEIDINGTSGSDSITIGNSSNRNTFTGVSTDVMDFSVQVVPQ